MLAGSWSEGIPSIALAQAERHSTSLTLDDLIDNYGYTAAISTKPWVEISGTEVLQYSPNSDDGYAYNADSSLFTIPFLFPFYEKNYAQVRISTNGYLTLDTALSEPLVRNLDLPSDQKPNNILAPFWDDLTKGENGKIYFASGNLDGQDYFAVKWASFNRFNTSDLVTFQVLLLRNGDILFQYGSMNGNLLDASVGIEDGDGVDGISYFYNGTGTQVASSSTILFTRPGAGRRAKLTPFYSGGFVIAGKAQFDIKLTNTGNVIAGETWDSYDFSSMVTKESIDGWQVLFYLNGQPVTNSDVLNQTANQVYQVLVSPPPGAQVGDHALIDLTATSTHDPTKNATVHVQVAVPAKLIHAYADSTGTHLGLYWKENIGGFPYNQFDENIALAPAGEKYVMAWDYQVGYATNLNYILINKLGVADASISLLEYDNSTTDRFPSLAGGVEPGQQVVAVWPRYTFDQSLDEVFELMLAVIDPQLEPSLVQPPVSLTEAPKPYSFAGGGVQIQDVSAQWVGTDQVWIIWKGQKFISISQTTTDILAGLYSLSSGWVIKPQIIAAGTLDIFYSDPTLIAVPNGPILAFFSGVNLGQKTQQIYWSALGPAGVIKGSDLLGTLQGGSLDAALLGDRVMLARVTPDRGTAAYNLLTLSGSGSDLSLAYGETKTLALENLNLVEHVSLFSDQGNQGILTWKNVDSTQMYYALVDSSGEICTPAMMFYRDPSAKIRLSKNGQSSAFYIGAYRIFTPRLSK
jgi:hypothetical protein